MTDESVYFGDDVDEDSVSFSDEADSYHSLSSPTTIARQNLLNKRYELLEMIGKGGFGAVHLCKDTKATNEERLAVKMVSCDSGEEATVALGEVLPLRGLLHPNLLHIRAFFLHSYINPVTSNTSWYVYHVLSLT